MLKADKETFLPLPSPLSSHALRGSVCMCFFFLKVCVHWQPGMVGGRWEDEEGDADLRPGLCSLSYSCRRRR